MDSEIARKPRSPLLVRVLHKNPATTHVVIDEVELDNWGLGGLTVTDFRKQKP